MFLGAVAQNAVEEGTIIEINVTAPNGAHYETNLKLRAEAVSYTHLYFEIVELGFPFLRSHIQKITVCELSDWLE